MTAAARPGLVCELTPRCNLECAFCYNVWRAPWGETPSELPSDRWVEVLERAVTAVDAEWLAFTGGEPLLYGEVRSLLHHVGEKYPQIAVGLATNGTLLTSDILSGLIGAGLSHLELPLFTLSRQRYLELTGVDGLEAAKSALASASTAPLTVTVAVTLLPDTPGDDLEEVLELAAAFGADRIALNRFVPTGSGVGWAETLPAQTGDVLAEQLARANALAEERALVLDVTLPVEDCLIPHEGFPALRFHPCLCAKAKWVIDPAGRLRSCEQNDELLGDLLADDWRESFHSPEVACFRDDHLDEACPDCARWAACGGGCRFARNR